MNNQETIESFIFDFPICEIYFIEGKDLLISDEVRIMCQNEARYENSPRIYPPALDSLEECHQRLDNFKSGILFSTIAEVNDAMDYFGCIDAMREHEKTSFAIQEKMKEHFPEVLTLTTGCALCQDCCLPTEPCRCPKDRIYTMESHGISIIKNINDTGICCNYGNKVATYLTLILFNDK